MFWCIGLSIYTNSIHVFKCHRNLYLQCGSTKVGYFFNGVFFHTLGCERCLFCSKLRVNASVTCALRVYACHARARSTAHLRCVLCVFFHVFASKTATTRRLFTHYLAYSVVSFHEMTSIFFFVLAPTRCGHEPVLLWCHAVKLTSFCGMAVNPVRILVPRLKQLPRKCKRGILVVNMLAIWRQLIVTPFKQFLLRSIEDNYNGKTFVFSCASMENTNYWRTLQDFDFLKRNAFSIATTTILYFTP